jgi:hypothetical protein
MYVVCCVLQAKQNRRPPAAPHDNLQTECTTNKEQTPEDEPTQQEGTKKRSIKRKKTAGSRNGRTKLQHTYQTILDLYVLQTHRGIHI